MPSDAHPFQALPEIFFTSDAVLHIDGEWPDLDCELEEVRMVGLKVGIPKAW